MSIEREREYGPDKDEAIHCKENNWEKPRKMSLFCSPDKSVQSYQALYRVIQVLLFVRAFQMSDRGRKKWSFVRNDVLAGRVYFPLEEPSLEIPEFQF